MRHGKKVNHLSRKSAHRKAMLANMACSLIEHKRIKTTLAKAKALRVYVEPLLTKSKTDTTHSRRVVFSYLQNKEAVKELFQEINVKIANRPGGYTRILKLGPRAGDNAEMALIELVDYNEEYSQNTNSGGSSRRRRRKKKSGGSGEGKAQQQTQTAPLEPAAEEAIEDAVVVEEEVAAEVADEVQEVVAEEAVEEVPAEEEVVEEAPETEADEDEDKKDA